MKGRPPKLCDQCDHRKNGARRERQRKKPSTAEPSSSPFFVLGQGDDTRPDPSTWSERLAVGLSMAHDVEAAARAVGLGFLPRAELARLEVQARGQHPDLVAGKSSAVVGQLHVALALASLELRARATSLSPGVLATSVKALTTAIGEFSGGSQRIFSTVILEMPRDHGEGSSVAEQDGVADHE